MHKIEIAGIEPIQEYFFNSCFYSSLFPIIQYYRKSVIPFMINGLGVYMFYNNSSRCSIYIKFYQENNLQDIFEEVGLGYEKIDICNELYDTIINHIKDEKPVIVAVDCYYESIRPDVYQKTHMPHYLLIYGYDYEKQEYLIIEQDQMDDIRYQKKNISRVELEIAYAHFIEKFFNANWGTYWSFFAKNDLYEFDVNKYFKRYLYNLKKNKSKIDNGMNELIAFYKRFVNILADEQMFFLYVEDIIEGMNDIIKYMNAKKIQYSCLFSKNDICMKLFEELYNSWILQRVIIVKCFYMNCLKPSKKNKLIENFKSIVDLSEKLKKSLLELNVNERDFS